jgi:arylsulfatase A-like enzyme
VESRIVENTDLLPSIMETAGLPVPEGVQGRSFLKLARGGDAAWRDRCFSQLATAMYRDARFKFIDNSRDLSGAFELYDMRNDPKEERNLAAEAKHRDFVAHAKEQLTRWRADKPAPVKIAGMATPDYGREAAAPARKRPERDRPGRRRG